MVSTALLNPSPADVVSAARSSFSDLWVPVVKGAYLDARRPNIRNAPRSVPRTTFDPTRPASIENPYPDLARIRESPVVVNEKLGVWMLGRYHDVHAAARDNTALSSRAGIMLRSFVTSAVLVTDPPDHTRLRHIAAPMFNKRAVQAFTADIKELAAESLATLRDGAVVDMVPALAVPMPINVIARLLGIPRDQWPTFRAISQRFAQAFAPRSAAELTHLLGTLLQSYVQLRSYIDSEIRRRADQPVDDLLTRLQQAQAAGQLSSHETFNYALTLLIAGNETTTNLLGMLLIQLAQNPEMFAALKADRSLLPAAAEEAARWGSPVQWVTRTVTAPYRVGDIEIPQGSRAMLLYNSANRDPAQFNNPDRFDINRDATGHLAFGHGMHFCLGAHLARLEVTIALDYLLTEIDGLELAGPVRWGTTPSLQGPVSVPVRIVR